MEEAIPSIANMLAWQQSKDRLPVIQRRAEKLRQQLDSVNIELADQRQTVAGEQADVDRLNGRSLGNFLLEVSQQMGKRQQREKLELIQARRKLDALIIEQQGLESDLAELELQIAMAQEDEQLWQKGMRTRADWLKKPDNRALAAQYQQVEAQIRERQIHLTEIEQVRQAAVRASGTVEAMKRRLDSAEHWGMYDVWFKGGILSHAIKYNHLDATSELMDQLTIQLRALNAELTDVAMTGKFTLNTYSSGTRALDYFFDNIFTDLSVRSRIRDDLASMEQIGSQLEWLGKTLDDRRDSVQATISHLKIEMEKLLLKLDLESC